MLSFMLIVGLYFTVKSNFFQFRKIRTWLSLTLGACFKRNKSNNKKDISAFSAMTTALAGAMGTGNIVGVATAIALGGAGAVFWMWIASILGMMTIFAENVLGHLYKTKDKNGNPVGGAMYYISKGVKSKTLTVIFCGACIAVSLSMGNMTQSNSIAGALDSSFNVPTGITAIIIMVLTAATVLGGIKRISAITEKIVPIMTIFFMLGGLIVIGCNICNMPAVLSQIIHEAFNMSAVAGGAGGYVIANAIKQGVSKGVFSNEAGLGSSPIIYSASDIKSPVEQGMWGIFQVFIDTIIGCSITAFCVLSTGVVGTSSDGVVLSINAFSAVFGDFGAIFVAISIILFAFATLISWSYYGEQCIIFLTKGKGIVLYRTLYVICAGIGCLLQIQIVWDVADIFNVLMSIPNLIAILLLSKQIIGEVKRYDRKTLLVTRKQE